MPETPTSFAIASRRADGLCANPNILCSLPDRAIRAREVAARESVPALVQQDHYAGGRGLFLDAWRNLFGCLAQQAYEISYIFAIERAFVLSFDFMGLQLFFGPGKAIARAAGTDQNAWKRHAPMINKGTSNLRG